MATTVFACESDSGGGMQVNEETCISLSCSKVGLYACTANDSANVTFLFCLDSLLRRVILH